MSKDQLTVERARLLAEVDQLRAERDELQGKLTARKVLDGLREIALDCGRCPVCRGTVAVGGGPGDHPITGSG